MEHGGSRNGAGRPIGKVNKRIDRVTGEERIGVALDAVLAAIDNMAREAEVTRLTAVQLSVISRKREYDDAQRVYATREYRTGRPPRNPKAWETERRHVRTLCPCQRMTVNDCAGECGFVRRNGAVSQP